MTDKIRKIGTVQHLDDDGFIINDLSLDNIQAEYTSIIDDTLAFYKTHFTTKIHSIYLRGSVAKGSAVPYISDLDTFAVSYAEIDEKELTDRISFWDEMSAKYPFLNGIEIFFISLDKVMSSEKSQFLLKTQCICIFGKDLNNQIPKFGIGKWAYAHSYTMEEDLRKVKTWLVENNTKEELKEICCWIMKRVLRIGFELVMEKERCFTRDLYPCYESFSKHYPNKSSEMKEALRLAVFPTDDMNYMWDVIHSIYDFLIMEVEKRN